MRLRASRTDLLTTLAAEQAAQSEGNRNTELFRRARVALEAGYESADVYDVMLDAGRASGLSRSECDRTLQSAFNAELAVRVPDGTPPKPPSEWEDIWERTWPRIIGVDRDKKPVQRWQYGWDEPNDAPKRADYQAIVIPPGLLVLDVDDATAFKATGLPVPADAPAYPTISSTPERPKAHFWFRAHPDRPYPTRTMAAWPGADLLVGGYGIANVPASRYIAELGDPGDLPFAPDWVQPRASSRIRNIEDYLRDVPLTIPWVIDDFAFVHGLTLVAGSPKAGKSTLSFEAMRCRETGEPFLDKFVRPGPTLLVTEEGGVSIRFKGGELHELDVYDRKASAGETFEQTLAVVADWCSANPGGLVFIDTLAAWAQVEDENDSAEMQAAIDGIRLAISEPFDVAVVLIHHARKGGGRDGEAIRGSGAILAAVDHVVELRRGPENHKNRRVIDIMSRVLHEFVRWTIDWDGDTQRYAVVSDDAVAAERYENLEDEVASIPSGGPGLTIKDIGVHHRRLAELVNMGRVRKQEGSGRHPALYWGIPPVGRESYDDDTDE